MIVDLHCRAIALGDFVGVAGAKHVQAGNGAAGGQMLDRLVGRAIFADADRIVRQDVEHRLMHDAGQPHAAPHVVGKDEEGRRVRSQARQRQAVDDSGHGVFANAEVQVASRVAAGQKLARTVEGQRRLIAGGQIGRTADHQGNVRGDRIEHLAAGVAGRIPFFARLEHRNVLVPAVRQVAVQHRLQLARLVRD